MNARKTVIIFRCWIALFTLIVVFIAALELVVALKFQFSEVWVLDFILPWPIERVATVWATWGGAALWAAVATAEWTKTLQRNPRGLTIMENMLVTALATISVLGIIVEPFWLAVWMNATIWGVIAAASVISLPSAWNNSRIRYTKF